MSVVNKCKYWSMEVESASQHLQKKRMSDETCTPLQMEKKLLLARKKMVRARKFELLIPGQQKAKMERTRRGGRQPGVGERCPTAPSPAARLSLQPRLGILDSGIAKRNR